MKTFNCCICGAYLTEKWPANPEPFGRPGQFCCNDCDNRFVIPVRIVYGRDVARDILEPLQRIATLGRLVNKAAEKAQAFSKLIEKPTKEARS